MSCEEVEHISECFIKPKYEVDDSKHPHYLSPWDLLFLGGHYNQKGLFFIKPNNVSTFSMDKLLESLKDSLALTLVHFYPLAGQLATVVDHDHHRSLIFVDCRKGPGVRFVHATLDVKVSDLLFPKDHYVPRVVKSLFDHSNGEANYDGHSRSLLTVQVTELVDGVFIGCSMNHVIVDGTSFWHFWNVWSEIHRAGGNPTHISISDPPIHKRWIPEGYLFHDSFLPYTHPNEFIRRREPHLKPVLGERFFHFSAENVSALKSKANKEVSHRSVKISSFQALMALVWKSIIRARNLDRTKETHFKLAVNNRRRLDPPLPEEYFGNALSIAKATTQVDELLGHGIGWAALLLNQAVDNHRDEDIRSFFHSWMESPKVMGPFVEAENTVQVGSSHRFPVYENCLNGLGKPVAVRSGYGNKFRGKVMVFPGKEGQGSVDLEVCLPPHTMKALELDHEFMAYVSPPSK